MNKFFTIFEFEFKRYLKSKVQIILTAILTAVLIIAGFIPQIRSFFSESGIFKSDEEKKDRYAFVLPKSLKQDDFQKILKEALNADIVVYEALDEITEIIKTELEAEKIQKAFVFSDEKTYTYYVKNTTMYDKTPDALNQVLKNFLQAQTLKAAGLSDRQRGDFFNISISHSMLTLGTNPAIAYAVSNIVNVLMYLGIVLFSGVLASNIGNEKYSKAVEVLVTSVHTSTLLFAKVLAMIVFILLEFLFLGAVAYFSLKRVPVVVSSAAYIASQVGSTNLLLCAVFVFLGISLFLFLTSIFAAQITKVEEIGYSTMPSTFLIIIPYMLTFAMQDLNGIVYKSLSFFPFFTPVMMTARLLSGGVPVAEIMLSLLAMLITIVALGFLAAKFYRSGILKTGSKSKAAKTVKKIPFLHQRSKEP